MTLPQKAHDHKPPRLQEVGMLAPHSVEAEEALLGALIMDPDLISAVQKESRLEPGHFYIVRHAWIYETMLRLQERGEQIDYVTLVEALRQQGQLDEIGGPAYITKLINETPMSAYAYEYAVIVYRAAWRRRLLAFASETAKLAHAEEMDTPTIEALLLEQFEQLRLPHANSTEVRGIDTDDLHAELLRARNRKRDVFVPPWPTMAKYVPAVELGTLVILSGFSGSGKTAMCEAWAEYLALTYDLRVCYAHTEVKVETMLDRRLARHSGVPYAQLRRGDGAWSEAEHALIDDALAFILVWSHLIDFKFVESDPASPEYTNARQLVAYFEHEAKHRGTRVFIVDYFQDVEVDTSKTSEPQARRNFLYALRRFAEKHNVIVIVSTQMTETAYGGRTYGTRAMDQKAALQIDIRTQKLDSPYTYGNKTWEKGERSPEVTCVLVKNTFGPPDVEFKLFYDGPRFWWRDMDEIKRPVSADLDLGGAS